MKSQHPYKPVLYLAGPMGELSWKEASEWRRHVHDELDDKWTVLSPITGQFNKDQANEIIPIPTQEDKQWRPIEHTASGFVSQDEWYIERCDWLLANFMDVKKVSVGTVCELALAYGLKKKIISVIQPGSPHDHGFIRRWSNIFTKDLEEAIAYLKKVAQT